MKLARFALLALVPVAMLALPTAASAQLVPGVLAVEATVLNSCVIAGGIVSFVYDPADPNPTTATVNGVIEVATCFDPYEIAIDQCSFGTATNDRQMDFLGNRLAYSLSCATEGDPKCATNWGDQPGETLTGTPGVLEDYTVDGQIPAQQGVPSGVYVDTCTLSLSF